jgi:hypothetical protein
MGNQGFYCVPLDVRSVPEGAMVVIDAFHTVPVIDNKKLTVKKEEHE